MNKVITATILTFSLSMTAVADNSESDSQTTLPADPAGMSIPSDELGKFMENTEKKEFSEGNREGVSEQKEDESTGMFMFRMFRDRVERSAKEFEKMSGESQ